MKRLKSGISQENYKSFGRLGVDSKLILVGFSLSLLAFLAHWFLVSEHEKNLINFLTVFTEHLAYAFLIATLVGLSLDRLFHHSLLSTLLNQTPLALKAALRDTGGKYQVTLMDNPNQLYDHLIQLMKSHRFLLTTTLDLSKYDKKLPDSRSSFFDEMLFLMANGQLRTKEVVSPLVKKRATGRLKELNSECPYTEQADTRLPASSDHDKRNQYDSNRI